MRGGVKGPFEKIDFYLFIFFVVMAGYACAFGYSAAQAAVPGQDSALAGWLVAHGRRYGLGQSPSNVVTVDSGARVEVVPVAVRWGRCSTSRRPPPTS